MMHIKDRDPRISMAGDKMKTFRKVGILEPCKAKSPNSSVPQESLVSACFHAEMDMLVREAPASEDNPGGLSSADHNRQ